MALPPKQPKGTGYVNLSNYIGANQNNQLGSALSGGIQNTVDASKTALDKSSQAFGTNLQQTQDRLAAAGQGAKDTLSSALSNPSAVDDKKAQDFVGYVGSQYNGPTGLENSTGVMSKAKDAYTTGQLTASRGGRQELLRRYVGGPNYTQGKQRLDELVMGENDQLKSARRGALQTLSGAERGIVSANNKATEAERGFETDKQGVKKTLADGIGGVNESIDREYQNALQKQTQQDEIAGRLSAGNYSDLDSLNLAPEVRRMVDAYRAQGLNPNTFLRNEQAQNVTKPGVASKEQQAQLAALSKLAQDNSITLGEGAGTYQVGQVGYDKNRLYGDAQNRYSTGISSAQASSYIGSAGLPGETVPQAMTRVQSNIDSNLGATGMSEQQVIEAYNSGNAAYRGYPYDQIVRSIQQRSQLRGAEQAFKQKYGLI